MSKRKHGEVTPHPIDASGVLQAAKMGQWDVFRHQIENTTPALTPEDFNTLPPGRSFGVIHQIAYHGHSPEAQEALQFLVERHPLVDLKLRTKSGETARQVAAMEDALPAFRTYLDERLRLQTHHELINMAREGEWPEFWELLGSSGDYITVDIVNSVPAGRIWGILHQVCYWGDIDVLNQLADTFPTLNLELETREEAAQLPSDIAIGRGNTEFVAALQAKIETAKPAAEKPAASLVTAPSSAMKVPVPAAGKLCNICYMDDHEPDTVAVSCDNDHFMCQTCFAGWVESESDIDANPQNILLNGGRITCVCKKVGDGCDSLAYANKLIAMVVPDELYEKYLRARDFVVGKEAVAGALSKVKGGDMNAVEQEQIRNMYRTKDGSYSAYMCGQCSFGPIDHGWCSNLSSHHGEKKAGGGNIDNSCPKCHWFTSQIAKWPRWDGKFQSADAKGFKPPLVSSMSVPQLKAALKSRGAPVSGAKAELQMRLQALYDAGEKAKA